MLCEQVFENGALLGGPVQFGQEPFIRLGGQHEVATVEDDIACSRLHCPEHKGRDRTCLQGSGLPYQSILLRR